MTNEEKRLLIRICKTSISKEAAKNKVDFHFLSISKSTLSKYWRLFGGKETSGRVKRAEYLEKKGETK